MKPYKFTVGVMAAGMLFSTSCSNDMNYKEASQYDKKYVTQAFENVMGLMTTVYRNLDYDFGDENYYGGIMLSSATDESEYSTPESSIETFWNGEWSPSTPVATMWTTAYSAISYCNEILDEFQGLKFEDLQFNDGYDPSMFSYNNLKWEARWARAYFYFNLVRQYGDVPLKIKKMSADEANSLSRTPSDEIFKFIIDECDAIKDNIAENYADLGANAPANGQVENGRADRLAVLALKARAALYHASPLFNKNNDKELWKVAAEANKELLDYAINERDKHLASTYDALWSKNNFDGVESSAEIIFSRRNGAAKYNTLESTNYPMGVVGGGGGNCPTQNLVDAYDMLATGKSIDEAGSGYDESNPYVGRDPRLALTIVYNGSIWPTSTKDIIDVTQGGLHGEPQVGATPTGYYLKKLLHGAINLATNSKYKYDLHTWVTYRLAEFYLNYAEAVFNYTGDPYSTAFGMTPVEAASKTRERVGMPAFPEGLTPEQFKNKYENERFVELAFEGHRFWDVRRWKEAPKYFTQIKEMKLTKNANGSITYTRKTVNRNWDDKMYLFPIPVNDILRNPNLKQNPGW